MALTHDGLQTPLAPSRVWQLASVVVLAAGVWLAVNSSLCPAIGVLVIGALMLANQTGGVTRTRITFSKLLVEDERPVMGFLIGPSKRRIAWGDFESVEVQNGEVVAKGKGTTLELGKGSTPEDLEELARRIRDAAQRFREENVPL
jgi:hypothetical protein